ncbi:MAG: hypothetical protein WEB06_13755 [Actinomycetota bacterium]
MRELTKQEILKLIDERAQFLLGISGKEFMRRYRRGELKDAPVEEPITVLAGLVEPRTMPLTEGSRSRTSRSARFCGRTTLWPTSGLDRNGVPTIVTSNRSGRQRRRPRIEKSRTHESMREEAERLDDLEEKDALDPVPFTRLRRYAKEPSQVYAIRIPASRLEVIRRLAERRKEQPTALLREWVLERLDEELAETGPKNVREDPPIYRGTARPAKPGGARRGSQRKAAKKPRSSG